MKTVMLMALLLASPVVAQDLDIEDESSAEAEPTAAKASATVQQDDKTIAERGGMLGLGLSVAPKVGGGLGSIFLEGAGATLAGELELGYSLPFDLPRGRDLQLFTSVGYAGPSSTATVDANDPRLPGGGDFSYALTLHQLVVTPGVLYRIPVNVVDWWRPYASLGLRAAWSWTVIDGEAGGQAFGTYTERAFDLGGYGALGSDFYVGPGAVLVELQTTVSGANRFVLRDTANLGVQLAVGYRMFL